MGIQDDIFDVSDALKNKPEAKAFKRIVKYLAMLEKTDDENSNILSRLRDGFAAIRDLYKVRS
jgi:hypothetical protein